MESWGNHIAIVVEGVLKQPHSESLIIAGVTLYKSLVAGSRVSLIFDGPQKNTTHHWLMVNRLLEHTGEVYQETTDPVGQGPKRVAQVTRLLRQGPLALVLESDTEAAAALLERQIPTFLFLHPSFTHPEHRPDYKAPRSPWSDVVSELGRQKEARLLAESLEYRE